MAVLMLVMGMSVFHLLVRVVIMLMFMNISFMGMLMLMHFPIMLMGMFVIDFGMIVLVFMGNTIHVKRLLSYPNFILLHC
jgi:hypothetical protein